MKKEKTYREQAINAVKESNAFLLISQDKQGVISTCFIGEDQTIIVAIAACIDTDENTRELIYEAIRILSDEKK